MTEAEIQREHIRSLLRNKYYGNNYAMIRDTDYHKNTQLKSRFPLYDMVLDDDDFKKRLHRRKNDVAALENTLSRSIIKSDIKGRIRSI